MLLSVKLLFILAIQISLKKNKIIKKWDSSSKYNGISFISIKGVEHVFYS